MSEHGSRLNSVLAFRRLNECLAPPASIGFPRLLPVALSQPAARRRTRTFFDLLRLCPASVAGVPPARFRPRLRFEGSAVFASLSGGCSASVATVRATDSGG